MNSALVIRLQKDHREDEVNNILDFCVRRCEFLEEERERSDYYRKRLYYEKLANSDNSHRTEGIFAKSNISLPVVRSIVRYLRGRVRQDIFGSSPWFVVHPHGQSDAIFSERLQKHFEYKLKEADYAEEIREGLSVCLELGEIPIKISYTHDIAYGERMAFVAVEAGTDNPIPGIGGQPIEYEDAAQLEDLQIDLSKVEWKEMPIPDDIDLYKGLSVNVIDFRDVLIPLNVKNVEKADFVAHRYACRLSDLKARFSETNPEWDDIESILKSESTLTKDFAENTDDIKRRDRESDVANDDDPPIRVTECYFEYDPFKEGRKRRIYAVISEDHNLIFDLRYLAEISPGAKYPISVFAINKRFDSWTGVGMYEIYNELAEEIDRLINNIRYRNEYNSDPAKIANLDLIDSGDNDNTVDFRPGKILKVKQRGIKPEEVLTAIPLPDLDNRTWNLMELYQQFAQVESGVTNASQGDLSGLPTNTTATGINSMLESSSVLHIDLLDELRLQFSKHLKYAAKVCYFWQDQDETFEFLEGKVGVERILSLSDAKRLNKMDLDVDMVMTRTRKSEMRESATAAIPAQEKFFTYPPELQRYALPLYLQLFKGMGIDDSDDMFPQIQEIQNAIDKMEAERQLEAQAMQAEKQQMDASGPEAAVDGISASPDLSEESLVVEDAVL